MRPGRPEAVLTPEESAAFVALVKDLIPAKGGHTGMRPGGGAPIIVNYNGTTSTRRRSSSRRCC